MRPPRTKLLFNICNWFRYGCGLTFHRKMWGKEMREKDKHNQNLEEDEREREGTDLQCGLIYKIANVLLFKTQNQS